MTTIEKVAKFHPGDLFFTSGVLTNLDQDDILRALVRHLGGDWGEVDEHDRIHNDHAAENGGIILSVYRSRKGVKFWVKTEGDPSITTFLLPKEN
jgi:hypothetical protein